MAGFEELVSPWLAPVLVSIIAAAASAIFALWSNIRQKAWLFVYQEKRREIREFLRNADLFASTVVHGCEVRALDERPVLDQLTAIMFLMRLKWGADPARGKDPLAQAIYEMLPTTQEVLGDSPQAGTKLQLAKRALLNAFEEELQHLNLRMAELRTTLALSLWDPDTTQQAQAYVAQVYQQVHASKPAYAGFDADKFAEEWSKEMTPIKLALRKDLNRSSRSLGAATRLSWRWRFQHSRLGKWLARKRDRKAAA